MPNFGWSLPAGCESTPGEDDETPDHLACPHCSTRLSWAPTENHTREEWVSFDAKLHSYYSKEKKRINKESGIEEILWETHSWSVWVCPSCEGTTAEPDEMFSDDIYDNFRLLHIPEIINEYETIG